MSGSPKDHATDLTRRSQSTYISLLATLVVLLITLTVTGCGNAQGSPAQGAQSLKLNAVFPIGTAGQIYNSVVSVSGGNAPYHFSVNSGTMPQGLTLNTATGSISGTPTATGIYFFQIDVTDAPMGSHGSRSFVIEVHPQHHNQITVSITPSSATVASGQKQQFTASVTGTSNTAVTWTASPGSIDATGIYTAPTVSAQTNAAVTAVSSADSSASATATVTITPPAAQNPPTITTTSLPGGEQGSGYDESLAASGGTLPYTWSVASGTLPTGLALSSAGNISGLPSASGTYNFTVAVTDAQSQSAKQGYAVTITAGGNFDGPAELPRASVSSAVTSSPTPGNTISVQAGGSLQTALNNAQCGDTIQLQAGATFSGLVHVPAKACDDNHWIIVRTSAPDSALPAEGQRLTPCYAGVASLPNRPPYPCSNPQNVMARLSYSMTNSSGPLMFQSGANHYRLIGLEITRPADKTPLVALIAGAGAVDHVIFDRVWVHGTAQEETRRGIYLDGFTNTAIVDSYFNDFHCVAGTGTCTDSQTVSGGLGNIATGIWKIDNNFLEAAGENILLGGGPSTVVPSDITITNNHFYKVPQWQKGTVGFVGGYNGNAFVVKNHVEVKNGSRILMESNLFEYSWGGFSQSGYSVLIAPRNDGNKATGVSNLCAVCEGTDVTVRYSKISHVGAGVIVAAVVSTGGLGAAAAGRVSIHDLVVDDIEAAHYTGAGNLFLVMNAWPTRVLYNVSIRHVTGFADPNQHLLIIGNSTTVPQMTGFTFTDNLVVVPKYPVWASGGSNDCASSDVPVTVVTTCFTTYGFNNNVLTASPTPFPASKWPAANMFPSTVANVGFVNYNSGNGGDYHLLTTSPYKNTASDGRDPGADIDGVNAAIAAVE